VEREDWNRKYTGQGLLWSAEPSRFLVAETTPLSPGTALDLACGEGRNAIWLAERGWRVTAVDFSAVALEKARSCARERKVDVTWVEADLRAWTPQEGLFDLVCVLYLQLPEAERRQVLRGAANAVAAAGTFLLVGHDLENLTRGVGGPSDPTVLLTPDDVAAELPGLVVERAERVPRTVGDDERCATAIDTLVRARRPCADAGAAPTEGRVARARRERGPVVEHARGG
jgi:SAM-dependent methyltransferase